jgi:hypothetical protein
MISMAARYLLFVTLLSALAGCSAPAPFVLPGLDSRADATGAQAAPPAALPRYRYGYHPYGAYYGTYGYDTGSNGSGPREVPAGPEGTPGATPGPIAVEPPPRAREVEAPAREVRRPPAKAAESARPTPRQPER